MQANIKRMKKPRVILLFSLLGVLVAPLLGMGGCALARLQPRLREQELLPLPKGDPARGANLVRGVLTCTECHGPQLAGVVLVDEPFFARIVAPNLTPGRGGIGRVAADVWLRAIRHGEARDGRPLLMMPVEGWRALSSQDLADSIAFLQQVEPADLVLPASTLGPFGYAAVATGALHLPPNDNPPPPPQPAAANDVLARGRYLLSVSSCLGCHSATGEGRELAPGVVAPSLSPDAVRKMTAQQFADAVREGRGIDGRQLSALMPAASFRALTEDDLAALRRALLE